ncbi:MAG: hypothetical protein IJL01_07810, partial [Synergistaceae bacterium]|nr:hypothetical protein [Synergistaceae bacterium]
RIRLVSMQYLGNAPLYLGYVLKDDIIERSVKNWRIFYRADPNANASICVRNLAGELLRICEGANTQREKLPDEQTGVKGFFRRLAKTLFSDSK